LRNGERSLREEKEKQSAGDELLEHFVLILSVVGEWNFAVHSWPLYTETRIS
jgi:hypothetical protein